MRELPIFSELELQPSLYNCSGASCNCKQYSAIASNILQLQTHQIFRCNGAAALQFLASANLQVLQLQGSKRPFPPPPRGADGSEAEEEESIYSDEESGSEAADDF